MAFYMIPFDHLFLSMKPNIKIKLFLDQKWEFLIHDRTERVRG